MATSIPPLEITYSFAANKRSAVDRVNVVQLDATLASCVAKINEVITALDETLRDDDTLDDGVILPEHLNEEVIAEVSALVAAAVTG